MSSSFLIESPPNWIPEGALRPTGQALISFRLILAKLADKIHALRWLGQGRVDGDRGRVFATGHANLGLCTSLEDFFTIEDG